MAPPRQPAGSSLAKAAAGVLPRPYYDKKVAVGKTHKEALRSLKRKISDAIFARLQADTRQASAQGPGGQPESSPRHERIWRADRGVIGRDCAPLRADGCRPRRYSRPR
jgi:hypothetical protein